MYVTIDFHFIPITKFSVLHRQTWDPLVAGSVCYACSVRLLYIEVYCFYYESCKLVPFVTMREYLSGEFFWLRLVSRRRARQWRRLMFQQHIL